MSDKDHKDLQSKLTMTPIAIVGMASIFPESKDLRAYWENILNEADCITDVPKSRWNLEDYYDPDPKAEDKTYCKKGGFLPNTDFNPMEFGLPPNILEVTDVSQLLSLVLTREVLKDAGYGDGQKDFDRSKTGCIFGVGGGQKLMHPLTQRLQSPIWDRVLESSGIDAEDRKQIIAKMKKAYVGWQENSFPGTLGNVIAGRVANRFNFGSTNCVVDAACASSLAGIRMAISDLLEYRSDMMITGGVDTDNSPYMYMCFSKTPAFTKNDKVQPFDKNSSGIMIGEGIGFLALKRLEDAERDGDRIYSVIKGTGSSSDGKFKSIYAPRSEGQCLALDRAYKNAGIDPQTTGLIEAHGTGTKAGDTAEVNGLKMFFGEQDGTKTPVALGSVKSQIGHTKNAAGAAGIIKAALAVHHKVIPALINIEEPNPELDLSTSPLYLSTETRPWVRAEGAPPRRAGVSAFGFGGTNFHFVLEEHEKATTEKFRLHHSPSEIVFQADNKSALIQLLTEAQEKLKLEESEVSFWELAENSKAAIIKPTRLGFVALGIQQTLDFLAIALATLNKNTSEESWSLPQGIHFHATAPKAGKVVALFSGQGSPYLNMGKDIAYNFPPMLQTWGKMDALFNLEQKKGSSEIVFPVPVHNAEDKKAQAAELQKTENAQPAIGVMSAGLYQITKDAGFKPDFVAGHSFGELTALWAAGVYSLEDYLFLAKSRGEAMQAKPGLDAGSMLAVMGQIENLEADITEYVGVKMANFNSKKQIVLAGPTPAIGQAAEGLKAKGYTTVILPVSAAFHTPLVGHASAPFSAAIEKVKFQAPQVPVYSNATGAVHSNDPAEIQTALKGHILNSVRFTQEIEAIHTEGGRIFVEFGPQNILTKLVGNILHGKEHTAIAMNQTAKKPADPQFRDSFLQLRLAGVNLGDVDPYRNFPKPVPAKRTAMTIELSAANYVSNPTKQAFEDALNDGFQVKQAKSKTIEVPAQNPVLNTATQIEPIAMSETNNNLPQATAETNLQTNDKLDHALEAIDKGLASFHQHQTETVKAHEQFLANQKDYAETFNALISNPQSEVVRENLKTFHAHQQDTLRVHESYLAQQNEFAKAAFELIQNQNHILQGHATPLDAPAIAAPVVTPTIAAPVQPEPVVAPAAVETPVVEAPAPVQPEPVAAPAAVETAAASTGNSEIQSALFAVVAEKTGYMEEMLEASMDLEADLGIDSIKRVEILYAIQEKLPNLPQVNPEALGELRTLEEIINYLDQLGGGSTAPVQPEPVVAPAAVEAPAPVQPEPVAAPAAVETAAASTGNSEIQSALFAVVAEKTGYMEEMLEASMDLEADLGIDSIKRVEILYAIQEKLPNLPQVNPEALGELRTLEEIVNYLDQLGGGSAAPAAVEAPAPVEAIPAQAAPAASTGNSDIQSALFAVVAEKTGYMEEMLEASMDLEADLGIDSIKRVEILYAIQEKLPNLPQVNPEALGELRTLEEIVNYLGELGGGSAAQVAPVQAEPVAAAVEAPAPVQPEPIAAPAAVETAASTGNSDIQSALFAVVAEKTGYMEEMLEASMDLEADLGIDSIKRVEILYAIQEKLPNLPQVNPEALGELRTLEEIVNYLGELGGGSAAPVQAAPAAVEAPAPVEATPAQAAPAASTGNSDIQSALFAVVAEKTGYMEEMLEASMDLEADLGIDSIKRVEILYAIQEKLPNLPQVNPEALGELRTLEEIVNYLGELGGGSVAPVATVVPTAPAAPTETVEDKKKSSESPVHNWRSEVKLVELPIADRLNIQIPAGHIALMTYDGTATSQEVAHQLLQSGCQKVLFLTLPTDQVPQTTPLAPEYTSIAVKGNEDKDVQAALDEARTHGPIGLYIHAEAPHQTEKHRYFSAQEQWVLEFNFLLAKHISPDLNTASKKGLAAFMAITQIDGKLGLAGSQHISVIQAGIAGLVKTLKVEWPNIHCRWIDFSQGQAPSVVAHSLIAELFDADKRTSEVGYSTEKRYSLVAEPTDLADTRTAKITSDSVFVVSGGAKGVTARCVIELAKAYQPSFILLGRSPFIPEEVKWAEGISDEMELKKLAMAALQASGEKPTPALVNQLVYPIFANREIASTIQQIEAAGSKVIYQAADINNPKVVKETLQNLSENLGPITGIIHGAGVLADKLIEKKSIEDIKTVFNTKIRGLYSLLSATKPTNLTHVMLFSSAAGFYGNIGQSDYSAANEVLNKFAHAFRNDFPNCQVSSFNWGPWDGGMVTEELKRHFESRGVDVIPQDIGAQILVAEASSTNGVSQVVVGSSMNLPQNQEGELQTHEITCKLQLESNAFVTDHSIGGEPVLPLVHALDWMIESALGRYEGFHLLKAEQVAVLKGVVFNAELAESYLVVLQETAKTETTLTLTCQVRSEFEGRNRTHYSTTLYLSTKKAEELQIECDLTASETKDGADFYKEKTLFHGPLFQMVTKQLNRDSDHLTLLCKAPKQETLGQFSTLHFNPFADDAGLQALLVEARIRENAASLPLRISEVQIFKSTPFDKEFYVTLKTHHSGPGRLNATVWMHDQDGQVYSVFKKAEVIISAQLNDKF